MSIQSMQAAATPATNEPVEVLAMQQHHVTMLGTGLIGDFYTMTLHGQRGRDRVRVVYSRSEPRGEAFKERWGIAESTTDMQAAIEHPEIDVVVVALPNFLHEEAVTRGRAGRQGGARAPSRWAATPRRPSACCEAVEKAGVFARLPRGSVLHAQDAQVARVGAGRRLGDVPGSARARRIPGPHSAWFWNKR